MKGSGIGGQAVMEGVMMKNGDKYAVAVRKPDNEIEVDVKEHKSLGSSIGLNKVPIIRGVIAFIDSLVLGVGTLTYSASFFEEDEEEKKDEPQDEASLKKKERKDKALMACIVCVSVILAVGIFMLLPYFLSQLLRKFIESATLLALFEGLIRVALFVGYVAAISLMEDIKRVFMYHGAEHKSINCIEHGLPLTVENVRKQSRQHKRCGTSFLLIVMLISILFFMFIHADNAWLRVLLRLVLIPVIAGISYEFIRLAGKADNKFVDALSKPGLALQKLTTSEPDDSMIECAIASVEAVFDWKDFLEHYYDDVKTVGKKVIPEKAGKPANATKVGKSAVAGTKKDETGKAETKQSATKQEWEPLSDDKDAFFVKKAAKAVEEQAAELETKAGEIGRKSEEIKNEVQKVGSEVKEIEAAAENIKKEAAKIDLSKPLPVDDDEDDEILKKLDQYFILKQKKDNE